MEELKAGIRLLNENVVRLDAHLAEHEKRISRGLWLTRLLCGVLAAALVGFGIFVYIDRDEKTDTDKRLEQAIALVDRNSQQIAEVQRKTGQEGQCPFFDLILDSVEANPAGGPTLDQGQRELRMRALPVMQHIYTNVFDCGPR